MNRLPHFELFSRRLAVLLVVALLGFGTVLGPASAKNLNVKMATLSPDNSPWDKILEDMGKSWQKDTDGRVSLTIYPGGVSGDEADILRKMKIGQIHAAAISISGLADIDKDFTVFEVPLFYRDFAEMSQVLDELTPSLNKKLDEKGYVLLGWGYVGWVHFFTSKQVSSLDDFKALKIFTWAGDNTMEDWWRRNGFKPVALAATDIVTGLETGMIEAISVPPLYAMQMQFHKQTPYMADLGLAPLVGAILMSKRAFNRIDQADREAVLAAGRIAQKQVFERIPKLDETAVALMEGSGMKIVKIKDSDNSQEWVDAAEQFAEAMRGDIVPEPIFDEALAARDRYRAAQPDSP
ncbi:MAG: TRAP transporter substrate-binding protein DctP [Acidobacteriota bacterium]